MKSLEVIYSLDELPRVAQQIFDICRGCQVFTFTGSLGAGKTTLVKEMLALKGVKGPIMSPTYAYVISYENSQGERLHHFDLYRLSDAHEFFELGLNELLEESKSYSFIEWPEIILPYIKQDICTIDIGYVSELRRSARIIISST